MLALLSELAAHTGTPTIFDLSRDFAVTQTPTSIWQYGYSATPSLDPDQFRPDRFLDKLIFFSFWHPLTNLHGPGYYPYVAHNGTARTQLEPTHGWAARAGEVAMEASNSGQYSFVRFLVPRSGTYEIVAHFEGIHFRLSSTDVHILHNSRRLFDADIQGYGGDRAFHQIEGTHPTAAYTGSVYLSAHDTVIFAVGYGSNRTNYNDTTGLFARLVLISPSK